LTQREHWFEDDPEGDERKIPDDEAYWPSDDLQIRSADIRAFDIADPLVGDESLVELVMPNIESDDLLRPVLEGAVGETPGGGSDIEDSSVAELVAEIELDNCPFKFCTRPTHEPGRRAQ
jgi:hypothetical protein